MIVGAPKRGKPASYKKLSAANINIYLPKNAKVDSRGIEISLRGISFLRQLEVSGIKA